MDTNSKKANENIRRIVARNNLLYSSNLNKHCEAYIDVKIYPTGGDYHITFYREILSEH